jgi:hypothetical protein
MSLQKKRAQPNDINYIVENIMNHFEDTMQEEKQIKRELY